jgi:hypothetical protein
VYNYSTYYTGISYIFRLHFMVLFLIYFYILRFYFPYISLRFMVLPLIYIFFVFYGFIYSLLKGRTVYFTGRK